MTDLVHRNFVVPKLWRNLASDLCAAFSPSGGVGMFKPEYTTTQGSQTVTHYVSSGPISHDMAALLPCKTVTQDKDGKAVITTAPGMPDAVPTLATKAGISTTKTKITALYASIDVSDQPPFEAMARLGLQMVQVPLP